MSLYEKFRNSYLDLTILGLQDDPSIQCSPPSDAVRVLCWITDTPVCFCQIPDQGETVFVSDPDALPEEQLLPVAVDIPHFIGLLISCPEATLISKAYQWSSLRLKEQIAGIRLGMKAQSVIRALKNTYQPPVIDDPASMMCSLRNTFRSAHSNTDWKVGFDKDFSQPCSKNHCGKELTLNRSVSIQKGTWHVPSVYVCEEGIVVDTYLVVSADSLVDFRNRWGGRCENALSLSDKLQRQLENPLTSAVTGLLSVNDKLLRCKRSFTAVWNPLSDNSAKVRNILNHYRLESDHGYLFRRYCFLRKGKSPQIRSMQLTLEATPVMVPENSFAVDQNQMSFRFIHPGTGLEHRFTVLALTDEALNPNFLTNHPCYYKRLTYALEPSISPENFQITDCAPGDSWEGYQDDPAAVIYANRKPDPGRYALSSLHYEPQKQVRWKMIIRRKLHEDILVTLLP